MSHVDEMNKLAAEFGATVEMDTTPGQWEGAIICAPPGQCWESGEHMLRVQWRCGEDDQRSRAIEEVLARMNTSLQPCDDPDCSYCNEDNCVDDDDRSFGPAGRPRGWKE
jgi:hypothetical protein